MRSRPRILLFSAFVSFFARSAVATIVPLTSPAQITDSQTINFDGYPDRSVVNTLYSPQGITFSRDDAASIFVADWSAQGRVTTSPKNVLATTSGTGVGRWSTHLNVLSSSPLFAVGAYFGNDQNDPDFRSIRISVFGLSNDLLGSFDVPVNNNTSVDQFIGVRSDAPFSLVRFENLTSSGAHSGIYAVVLDDFSYAKATVPEPTVLASAALGFCAIGLTISRRRPGKVCHNPPPGRAGHCPI